MNGNHKKTTPKRQNTDQNQINQVINGKIDTVLVVIFICLFFSFLPCKIHISSCLSNTSIMANLWAIREYLSQNAITSYSFSISSWVPCTQKNVADWMNRVSFENITSIFHKSACISNYKYCLANLSSPKFYSWAWKTKWKCNYYQTNTFISTNGSSKWDCQTLFIRSLSTSLERWAEILFSD